MGGTERSEAAGRKPWGPLGGPLLKEATYSQPSDTQVLPCSSKDLFFQKSKLLVF